MHYWCIRHIYNPLRRRKIDKVTCGGIVFFVSALFHEYVISGALGYTQYYSFLAMFANFPFSLFQEYIKTIKVRLFFLKFFFRESISNHRCWMLCFGSASASWDNLSALCSTSTATTRDLTCRLLINHSMSCHSVMSLEIILTNFILIYWENGFIIINIKNFVSKIIDK